jgi:hypothetical protein
MFVPVLPFSGHPGVVPRHWRGGRGTAALDEGRDEARQRGGVMLTAIMIAMFYLGTAAGVMGSVLMGTFGSSDGEQTEALGGVLTDLDELTRAA